MGISERCFIFDLASLPLEVTRLFSLPCAQKWRKTSIIIKATGISTSLDGSEGHLLSEPMGQAFDAADRKANIYM